MEGGEGYLSLPKKNKFDRKETLRMFKKRCANMKAWCRFRVLNYDNVYAMLTRSGPLKFTPKQLHIIEALKLDGFYKETKK